MDGCRRNGQLLITALFLPAAAAWVIQLILRRSFEPGQPVRLAAALAFGLASSERILTHTDEHDLPAIMLAVWAASLAIAWRRRLFGLVIEDIFHQEE